MSNTLNQNLNLRPHDDLKDGSVNFAYDAATETLTGHVRVHIKKFFILDKTFDQDIAPTKIAKSILTSASIKAGNHIAMGPVTIDVLTVTGTTAACRVNVNVNNVAGSGTATIDLSQELIRIVSINANCKAFGFGEQLELVAA